MSNVPNAHDLSEERNCWAHYPNHCPDERAPSFAADGHCHTILSPSCIGASNPPNNSGDALNSSNSTP